MKENDYVLALKYLTPELIVAKLSDYTGAAVTAQIDRVNRFVKTHPKTPRAVLNGVIVLLLMTHKGKLPNNRYMDLTHDSFVNEHKLAEAEDIIEHIIKRKEYLVKKKAEKKQKRQDYYNNIVNPDISEVIDVTPDVIQDTKQMLEQLSAKKRLHS